ncbi:Aminopeptidase B [Willisornis vidua]|uniref:Aminopeptidase B n=1 Tax=Willisornis vidua TaxID=1566151 RepID=A0ABQ9DR22_9PASS|nr:Aminopeptidase B [Willisornis vidua]
MAAAVRDTAPLRDAATASSAGSWSLRHLHLELCVSFSAGAGAGRLRGRARLELRCERDDAGLELRLDTHPALCVSRASLLPPPGGPGDTAGQALPLESRPFSSYGSALHITLPQHPRAGQLLTLLIDYEAGEGPGVCWLAPEQTAGKQKPFMYTQGQAVLNRSFFPCFDTPSVKFTYSATVKVPEGFTAVMSATSWEKQKDNTFVFKMSQPIPSYLVALVVGDIVSADVGPRSRVWAEPCLIEAAKKEYNGVIEEFLLVGEKLFGPYVWGRYDILFMPPSFPFGGMENPCLTFVTPCLLAGDRSLVDVIIHEISHSWFGNLVTNATWGEFWLNEGFTMYAQRRISTEVYGVNPDDTYNETPYEKGYCFVSYLAHLVGDQSKFDAFLQAYVNRFKFQSITADDTLAFFLEYFPELKEKGVDSIPGFEFDRWLNTPGWPPYLPDLSPGQQLMEPADELAELWAADGLNMEAIEAVDITGWRTYQLVYFLDQVLQKSPLPEGNVERLSKRYPKISKAQNAELRLRWCQIVLKNNLEAEYSKVKDFLHSQGKQKYTLPLYRAMWGGSETARALAMETFSATAPQLHVNVQNYVKKILGLEVAQA